MAQAASLEPIIDSDIAIDPEALYEVVNGRRVELPPMGSYSELVANTIQILLSTFAHPKHLGNVVIEMLFRLTGDDEGGKELKRRPDVAFVSLERWPADREVPDTDGWEVVPNLAIEVISKSDRFLDVLAKLGEYFEAGVEEVWCVVPPERQVYVYRSLTDVTIIGPEGELDGGTILPGLRLPVARLFRMPGSLD